MRKTVIVAACAQMLAIAPSAAQQMNIEDPSYARENPYADRLKAALANPDTVVVPDLNAKPEFDSAGDAKYAYFHKAGVSFPTAIADIQECMAYGQPNESLTRLPGYARLIETPPSAIGLPKPVPQGNNQFGVVGAVIGPLIGPMLMRPVYRRHAQSSMRMCMGFKGYARYPTDKATYLLLYEGEDALSSVLMLAKIASGPAPSGKSVQP